jgi:hypothetical protein
VGNYLLGEASELFLASFIDLLEKCFFFFHVEKGSFTGRHCPDIAEPL